MKPCKQVGLSWSTAQRIPLITIPKPVLPSPPCPPAASAQLHGFADFRDVPRRWRSVYRPAQAGLWLAGRGPEAGGAGRAARPAPAPIQREWIDHSHLIPFEKLLSFWVTSLSVVLSLAELYTSGLLPDFDGLRCVYIYISFRYGRGFKFAADVVGREAIHRHACLIVSTDYRILDPIIVLSLK